MGEQRTHYVTGSDGVTIGGTVHGHGPALVFLQGGIGDGDLDWQRVVGHLADRFTCYLPSLRGRGLSDEHPDLSVRRAIEDYVAYVDSIGAPTGLVGWSVGANNALGVAARSDAVTTVAPFEPVVPSEMDGGFQAAMGSAAAELARLVAEGRLPAAARAFAAWPFADDEIARAEQAGYFDAAGRYAPNLLPLLQDLVASGDPGVDPAALGAISAPVVVLCGSDTKPSFTASARHVVGQLPDGRVQEISGVGHAAPLTHPDTLAEALAGVFTSARPPEG